MSLKSHAGACAELVIVALPWYVLNMPQTCHFVTFMTLRHGSEHLSSVQGHKNFQSFGCVARHIRSCRLSVTG